MSDWKWLGGTGFAVACAVAAIWVGYEPWPWVQPAGQFTAETKPEGFVPGGPKCRAPATEDQAACIAEAEAHRLSQNDLIQQTRAADAASTSAQMAVIQTKIGVIGAIGGVLTLVAAALAAFYARRAAIEAAHQVDLARKNLVASERGRMIIDEIRLGDLKRPLEPDDNGATEYMRRYINIGNGVAWLRTEATHLMIADIGEELNPDLDPAEEMNWPVKGGEWWGTTSMQRGRGLPLTVEQRQQVASGDRELYAFYSLTYTSGGPDMYTTRCVYKYRPSDGTMVPHHHPFWFHD